MLKAARALAGLSVEDLGKVAKVGQITIKRLESGLNASAETHARLVVGLNKAGVTLVSNGADGHGPGVRLTNPLSED